MSLSRRSFVLTGALSVTSFQRVRGSDDRPSMGVVIHCFAVRRAAEPAGPCSDPLRFLEHARSFGAGGIQTPLGTRDAEYIRRFRDRLEATAMYVEGIVRLPRQESEVERFDAELRTARECGASIVRTAAMDGRRYEVFRRAEDFTHFSRQARQSLALARPVAERNRITIAVENHKDWRSAELAELMREIRSPHVGVCLDTGNSIALLEPPQETLQVLAPFAVTTHIKDMGVEEHAEGFLLSEVPLGTGLLDLPAFFQALRRARPGIRFNLEMITRDPLRIPCLTPGYWATLESIPGRRLAEMLTLVRARAIRNGLPRISGLEPRQRLEREEENVRRSLRFAREQRP